MIVGFAISLIGLLMLLGNCILYSRTARGKDSSYRILTLYLMLLFAVEVVCHVVGILRPYSNYFLSHYYFIFQFLALSLFFYRVFHDQRFKALVVLLLVLVGLFLSFQYYTTPGLYWIFDVYEIRITTLVIILYATIYLLQYEERYFYFCFGLMSYLACSCFIFLSGNTALVLFTEPFLFDIWIFNALFYIGYQATIYKEWKLLNNK